MPVLLWPGSGQGAFPPTPKETASNEPGKRELPVTQQSMVAMAWFENPALYRDSRSIMSDKSSLPLAYMDWVDLAKRNEKILEATGAQGRPRPDLAGRLSRFLPTSRLRSR